MKNLVDIVKELDESYHNAKKNLKSKKEGNIFLSIVNHLFVVYGLSLGYPNSKIGCILFRSDLMRVKKQLRKEKNIFNYGHKDEHEQECENDFFKLQSKSYSVPTEGDGEVFTIWQVEELELNPDSY